MPLIVISSIEKVVNIMNDISENAFQEFVERFALKACRNKSLEVICWLEWCHDIQYNDTQKDDAKKY
jgi:hypothetical protein